MERQKQEVLSYGQPEDTSHWIMDVKRIDAHGSGVGFPRDLVRWLSRIDNLTTPSGHLQQQWIQTMTTASRANSGDAKD